MQFDAIEKDGKLAVSLRGEHVEAVMERADEGRVSITGNGECGAFEGDLLRAPDESWQMTMEHGCREEGDVDCSVRQFLTELGGEHFRKLYIV